MLLLALFGIWLGLQPLPQDSLSPGLLAEEQAKYYLQQVRENRQPELHLWALATLCQNRQQPELLDAINRGARSNPTLDGIEGPFCGAQSLSGQLEELALLTGSPDLLLASIVNASNPEEQQAIYNRLSGEIDLEAENSVSYKAVAARIIGRDSIDTSILPADRFHFAHFLLLFNNELLFDHEVFTPYYLGKMVETWMMGTYNPIETTLGNSLYLVSLFRTLYVTNNYVKISDLFEGILEDTMIPISEIRLNIYRYLDYSMHEIDLYDRSLLISRKHAIPLAQYFENDIYRLDIQLLQGVNLYRIGEINKAHEIFQSILAESQEKNIPVDKTELYTSMGLTYLRMGDIDKYFELHFDALEIAREENNLDNQFWIYKNLHITSRKNQNVNSAINYLQESQELAQTYGETDDLAEVYLSMGTFYRDIREDRQMAADYLQMADSLANQVGNYRTQIKVYHEIARLAEIEGDLTTASDMYDRIKQLASSREDMPVYLEVSIDKAELQIREQELDSVRQVLARLTPDNLSRLDFYVLVKARALQANYLIQQGQIEDAEAILDPLVDQVRERARNTTDLQSGFWTVRQEYLDAIQLYVDLLIDSDRPEEAVMELDKLKTINDSDLFQNEMVKSTHLTEQELVQYNQYTAQLNLLRRQQLTSPSGQDGGIQEAIDFYASQKRMLDRKITSGMDKPAPEFRQIRRQLGGNEVALHITELNDLYYIATISRRSVDFRKIELDKSTRSLFESAIEELAAGEPDLNKLYRIGEILQIDTLPDFAENVVLIPDSYLYQLPFDSIPLERPASPYSYGSPTYFIEKYQTNVLTSLEELIPVERPEREYEWDFAGFGISEFDAPNVNLLPLPHAASEIRQVSRELNNLTAVKTVLNEESTKEMFRNTAPGARILHLSTHSMVSDQNPLYSRIYMSGTEQGGEEAQLNSQIYAYELFDMDLNSEFVMLNSCESGSGSYLQGSGVVGISRALRYAGAESLALNLWSVNDMMASDFAVQFYKYLNSGDSKSEAMRKAKLFFLEQKNANPHHWATYMLIGNTDPVIEPHQETHFLFATGFMVYLVVLMGVTLSVQAIRNKPLSEYPSA